jgi:ribose transport system substrate-binding protein
MKDSKAMGSVAVLVIVAVVTALLFGYSDINEYLRDNHQSDALSKKQQITIIAKSTGGSFWNSVSAGASVASAEYNVKLTFQGPDNEEDYAAQNELIYRAVQDGTDAIVFSAIDYMENAKAINDAAAAGVVIVVIDSDVNSQMVSCRIGTDNYEAGCLAGKAALKVQDEKLKVGIVNFNAITENGQSREKGFRDTVLKEEGVEIVDTINVISTAVAAKAGTSDMLKRHPEINLVVTFNVWTSLGVGYAIRDLQQANNIQVVAFDNDVVSVDMLETGEVDGLIVQNPYAMGYLGIENACKLLRDEVVEKQEIDTAITLITKENMYSEECQRIVFSFDEL